MKMKDAVEIILSGRRSARRVGKEFVVDRDKLGRAGGFSSSEMDRIDAAVANIEQAYSEEISKLLSWVEYSNMTDIIEELEQYAKLAMPDYPNDLCSRAKLEIERLQAAKRRALAVANERVKENMALRAVLEKISGRREYLSGDVEAAAHYKPEDGLWTIDEYLADAALDDLSQQDTLQCQPIPIACTPKYLARLDDAREAALDGRGFRGSGSVG